MAVLSFLQTGTSLARRQLNLIDLFNIKDTLKQRGFNIVAEGKLEDTLLNSSENPIFESPYSDGKSSVLQFLDKFSEKKFRVDLRKQIHNIASGADLFPNVSFKPSTTNQQRYSKTVELLLAYQCVKNLSAFSSSFSVKIENAPEGGF